MTFSAHSLDDRIVCQSAMLRLSPANGVFDFIDLQYLAELYRKPK